MGQVGAVLRRRGTEQLFQARRCSGGELLKLFC